IRRRSVVPEVAAETPALFRPRHDSAAKVPSESVRADALGRERADVLNPDGVLREDVAVHPYPTDATGDVRIETVDASEWCYRNRVEHVAVHVRGALEQDVVKGAGSR